MGYKENIDDFFKKNKVLTTALCFIGFLLSAFYTYLSFLTKSDPSVVSLPFIGTVSLVALGTTLVMDGCKGIFFVAYEKTKENKYFWAWIAALCFSIVFSLAYYTLRDNMELNKTNNSTAIFNETIDKKAQTKSDIEIKKGLLEDAKKEKEDNKNLKIQYEQSIKGLQNDYNKENENLQRYISKGFWDRKSASENKLRQIEKQIKNYENKIAALDISDNKINQYDNEISKLTNEYNSYDSSKVLPNEKITSTLMPLFELLPFGNPRILSAIFNLIKSIAFEIFVCYLYNIANLNLGAGSFLPPVGGGPGKKSLKDRLRDWANTPSENTKTTDSGTVTAMDSSAPITAKAPIKFKIKKVIKKPAPVIQLVHSSPTLQVKTQIIGLNITDAVLEAFIHQMYESPEIKDGLLLSDGYKTMGKALRANGYKITDTEARDIHSWMKTSGIIEKRTGYIKRVILKDKDYVLKLIGKSNQSAS